MKGRAGMIRGKLNRMKLSILILRSLSAVGTTDSKPDAPTITAELSAEQLCDWDQ